MFRRNHIIYNKKTNEKKGKEKSITPPYLNILSNNKVQECEARVLALDVLDLRKDLETKSICLAPSPVAAVHVITKGQDHPKYSLDALTRHEYLFREETGVC